jgi:release factor glutamine methyltransferase
LERKQLKAIDALQNTRDELTSLGIGNIPEDGNEKALMNKNVLEHEPHLALFVDDDDALIFYKAIAAFGLSNLNQHGSIYLEINENLAAETSELFYNLGYRFVELKKDLNEKNRMLKVQK